jgi:hypothetical protein
MNFESCESKVANLLASLDNLPKSAVNQRLEVLIQCIAVQDKEMKMLKQKVGIHEESVGWLPELPKPRFKGVP